MVASDEHAAFEAILTIARSLDQRLARVEELLNDGENGLASRVATLEEARVLRDQQVAEVRARADEAHARMDQGTRAELAAAKGSLKNWQRIGLRIGVGLMLMGLGAAIEYVGEVLQFIDGRL